MKFDRGKSYGFSRISDVPVFKVGSTTHITAGRFQMNEPAISVRTCPYDVNTGSHILTLHNQLEVVPMDVDLSTQQCKFSACGDSGSLVLMKRIEEDNEYICIGMVEGGTSYGTSIVTPIGPILQACGVLSFKSFETDKLSEDLRNAKTEITNKIQSLESRVDQIGSQLGNFGSLIMQELREMKSRLPNEGHPP